MNSTTITTTVPALPSSIVVRDSKSAPITPPPVFSGAAVKYCLRSSVYAFQISHPRSSCGVSTNEHISMNAARISRTAHGLQLFVMPFLPLMIRIAICIRITPITMK